jgi:hypothetical protein
MGFSLWPCSGALALAPAPANAARSRLEKEPPKSRHTEEIQQYTVIQELGTTGDDCEVLVCGDRQRDTPR